jgi:putative transposase
MRFEHAGSLVHIMARGLDGKNIFIDEHDKQEFLVRFARIRRECGYRCLSWCLMPNHYHLFLRTNEQPMSALMRPLNGGYARWFNHKYHRRGYLFQDRFKSMLCQDQDYARQLIRYIHLNPVRSGEVGSIEMLAKWPWCGHGYLLNTPGAAGISFQDRNEALRRFGSLPDRAVSLYVKYLKEGIDKAHPETAGSLSEDALFEIAGSHKGWPAVIGDADFAKNAMSCHPVAVHRRHRQADYQNVLESIAKQVTARCEIPKSLLFQKGRRDKRSQARELFCCRAHDEEKIPYGIIARYLKGTIPPIMLLARRGKEQVNKT